MAQFNKYSQMPFIPYRITEYLANNNENIWKILKYDDYNCLDKPNLSFEEKMKLIWTNESDQENYRVFFSYLIENSMIESTTILKIFRPSTVPTSNIAGKSAYQFDILYGGKISVIEYRGIPCPRGDVIEHELLKTLNGKYVGGAGQLQFNTQVIGLSRSGLNLGNSKTFEGNSLVMGIVMDDIGEEGAHCD